MTATPDRDVERGLDKHDHLPRQAAAVRPLAKGTLGRRLVRRVAVLVALVAIALSAVVALAAYNIQLGQTDGRLERAASRGFPGGRFTPDQPTPGYGPLPTPGQAAGPGPLPGGQEVGTIFAIRTSTSWDGRVLADTASGLGAQFRTLSPAALTQLAELRLGSAEAATIQLADYGLYRVIAHDDGTTRLIVGVPLGQLTSALTSLVAFEALLSAVIVGAAVLIAGRVVVASLAPLNRLAATATTVSNLPLGRGEVARIVRVPSGDTDPISEVGRVGLAFNHMLDNVEGALAARHASEVKLRQFVADASHELRNPLAAIRGYAELTRRERDNLPPEVSHSLRRIELESDRMSSLVGDLLLLARLDSGPALDLTPTDVTEIVLDVTSDARAAGPSHRWSLNLPSGPVFALADRFRLHQVLANLLANARTHTPPGTRVETGVRVAAGQVVITVTDDGPGIPADLQPTVFERFTRAEASRARRPGAPSTGLGLAIVAAVVAAHHGTAEVDSVPGRTRFTIRLPAAPELAS